MATNIWNPLGIRTNPFFQEALDISESDLRPINLFVGRADEAEKVLQRTLGGDSTRLLVSGQPGVGKTTFIQHVKSRLAGEHGFAVSSEFCRVPHQLSVTALGADLLRAVVRSLRNVLPGKILETLDGFDRACALVEETEQRAWQWSVSVLGSGGGLGSDRKHHPPAFGPDQFQDTLAELCAGAMAKGVAGTVVHLNNLENLERDPEEATLLMRDARDYFLVPGLHLQLGATPEFHSRILSVHAQVRSIFPPPVTLAPMTLEEVQEMLQHRLDHLRIGRQKVTPPVTPELVGQLHTLFRGDLRGLLGALEEACYRALGTLHPAPLGLKEALPVIAPLYQGQLVNELSRAELAHLGQLAALGVKDFRQADVIDHLGLSQGRVSTLFSRLEQAQAILPVRSEGRSQYFTIAGRARLALSYHAD